MTIKKGKKVHKVSRQFSYLEQAMIDDAEKNFCRWALSVISLEEWDDLNSKHPQAIGRPLMIAVNPETQCVLVHPTPDRDYELRLRMAEIFEL